MQREAFYSTFYNRSNKQKLFPEKIVADTATVAEKGVLNGTDDPKNWVGFRTWAPPESQMANQMRGMKA